MVDCVLEDGKTPVLLGGEHTVTLGAVRACARRFDDLCVLYMDAHADLRDSYLGTRWGHASVARRISETCPIVEVGVRSISQVEREFAQARDLPIHWWPPRRTGDLWGCRRVRAALVQGLRLHRPRRARSLGPASGRYSRAGRADLVGPDRSAEGGRTPRKRGGDSTSWS